MEIYEKRRKDLLDLLDSGLALIPAALFQHRSHDTEYPFRQNSHFYYLTGFDGPQALLVLCPCHKEFKTALFVLPSDKKQETWTGKRLGVEEAQKKLGIDQVYSIEEIDKILPTLFKGHSKVYLDLFGKHNYLEKVLTICRHLAIQGRRKAVFPSALMDIVPLVGKMRLIKSSDEIEIIKKGLQVTRDAHLAAMAFCTPGKNEKDLQAILEYVFMKRGGNPPAYGSIVAGGNNANTLHYVQNNCVLKDGDLLLIDAGCEYQMYATDITRTFPVGGRFSSMAKEVYQLVLKAQQAAIAVAKPKNNLTEIHNEAVRTLTEGLIDLKVLKGGVDEQIEKKGYRKYYMHGTSHWLGLDVHDNAPYLDSQREPISLATGHVFTVEPGLYFSEEDTSVPQELKGIGIRIEDDVLITKNGNEVLSSSIPHTIEQIENACNMDYTELIEKFD